MGMPTLISWINHPILSDGVNMVDIDKCSYRMVVWVEESFQKKCR